MKGSRLPEIPAMERCAYSLIAARDGIKAKEIAAALSMQKTEINRFLFSCALLKELCYQDQEYRWHALIRQAFPHDGLYEFSGWYGTVREFMGCGEQEWLESLSAGCARVGRNLNDTRGLIHSFLDCRQVMRTLFEDLSAMMCSSCADWELVFELRINKARFIRIYADVLVITPRYVFSLEFKMKNQPDPDEVLQAAKYCPYLEVIFGPSLNVVPALVLTVASDLFRFVPIGATDSELPVVSGDMLFNLFDYYMGFLH